MFKEISIYQLLKFDVKYILCEFVHFVEPFFFLAILMTIIVKTRTIPTKINLLKIVLAILLEFLTTLLFMHWRYDYKYEMIRKNWELILNGNGKNCQNHKWRSEQGLCATKFRDQNSRKNCTATNGIANDDRNNTDDFESVKTANNNNDDDRTHLDVQAT